MALGTETVDCAAGQVELYTGNPKRFEIWLRDMEKQSEIHDFNDVKKNCLTGETSGGAVFEFIVNWTVKAGNAKRFV